MNIITDSIKHEREYSGILRTVEEQMCAKKPLPLLVTGMCEGARFAFYASLALDMKQMYGKGFLLIVPDEKEAMRTFNACMECGLTALVYPLRDFLFHNITASHEYEHERLSVLSAVLGGAYDIVIATPDAALQYTIPRARLEEAAMRLEAGGCYALEEIVAFLERTGYARVDMVNGAGQYSVRGGILDLFPPKYEYPVRVEFFGDEVEHLEIFDVMTQRRIERIDSVEMTPAREILPDAELLAELKKVMEAQIKKASDDRVKNILRGELEAVEGGTELHFIDKYIAFLYPERMCLMDYFDDAPLIVVQELNAVLERLKGFEWHMRQNLTELLEEGSVSARYAEYNKWTDDFNEYVETRASVIVDTFAGGMTGRRLAGIFSISTKHTVTYSDNIELLREDIGHYLRGGFDVVMLCENETIAKNLRTVFDEDDLSVVVTGELRSPVVVGVPAIVYGKNLSGFELTASKFAVLSLYANPNSYSRAALTKRKRASKKSSQEKIMSYADLEPGDYIVHVNHGIGKYVGLKTLTLDGVTKDFIEIQYAGTDKLYLPCNQLDMVSKYIGAHSEDGMLKLSKMGGTEWAKAKMRVKAAAKNMAKELIALYAERLRREGYAFAPDDEYQREFEAAFEYEETDGQLAAVDEIKSDMEKIVPMDRLLCGDVGFGKTEVALRAAFKAVSNSKQVAILVPTTILALQHYQTILARMRGFPVHVDMLSRFRTAKQQQETVRRLRRGEIDIIVGTHRVVSSDVQFKDLGLVIIDEEQRFGVAHKEKLKQLSKNVDVLTLTATPIPRTLNMAMSGIRDMSILEEAPGDRLPVQTYVLEYDELIIAEAIKKELRRGGQVFYLHNRVESMDRTAAAVLAMAPEARIAVAHGQMDKEQLSDIWRSLVLGDIDVLISTTIIETGVDVPNANTLIIERADHMGLSQLHQIRGRVGRSSRRAYAYFTYPKGAALSEVAEKRLMAIRDYTEFGSGFKIALRDLEIRGAGNLLGAEQHGHIDAIGYDMYMKLLNEAILEEKGMTAPVRPECAVDLSYDAFIPESYVRVSTQRIDAYKKIASIENEEDLQDISDELTDRYGKAPKPVSNLLQISLIRAMGRGCGLNKLEQREGSVLFWPEKIDVQIWARLAAEYRGRLLMNVGSKPYVAYRVKKGDDVLAMLCEMFKKYIQIQSENV